MKNKVPVKTTAPAKKTANPKKIKEDIRNILLTSFKKGN